MRRINPLWQVLMVGVLLSLAVTGLSLSVPGEEAGAGPHHGDRPYLPLFTQMTSCPEIITTNEQTGDDLQRSLDDLQRWYTHFHSESANVFMLGSGCQGRSDTTLAAKLSARGSQVSQYRHGSYVTQATQGQLLFGEAPDLEASAPLAIGTFWPPQADPDGPAESEASRLAIALDETTDTVVVTSAEEFRPAGAPATWPFRASRGTGTAAGAYSANTHDFVSWARVDDEIMQIVGAPVAASGRVTLSVRRGLWGTTAAAHDQGERVMAPVYVGSVPSQHSDAVYSGVPDRDDPRYALRYPIKIWQPDGHGWIARRIVDTLGPDLMGYNALWLDITSCVQYNQADASGRPVVGWDDPRGRSLDPDAWGGYQLEKLQALRAALPGVQFLANNLGGAPSDCTDRLLAAYDGGVLEAWLKQSAPWDVAMEQSFSIQANDWPGLYWARWNIGAEPERYRRFTYGSLLLSYRPENQRTQYGGPFGLGRPDDLFFWDWGTPRSTPERVHELTVAGTGLYRRDFTHGIVVVNPGDAPETYTLDGSYHDVSQAGPSDVPAPVTSVVVGPKDAVFLQRSDDVQPTTTTVEPTTTTTVAPTTTTVPPTTTTVPPTTTTTSPPGDTTRPAATISAPKSGQTLAAGPVRFSGKATDNVGVDAVMLSVQNRTTGKWWRSDGTWGAWDAHPTTLATPDARSTTWTLPWTPPRGGGSYAVSVYAKDTAGNIQPTPLPRVTFRVKG